MNKKENCTKAYALQYSFLNSYNYLIYSYNYLIYIYIIVLSTNRNASVHALYRSIFQNAAL